MLEMYLLLLGLMCYLLGLQIRVMSRNWKSSRFTMENFINRHFCLRICQFYVFKVVTVNTLSLFMGYSKIFCEMCINQIKNKGFHVTNIFMCVFSFSLSDIQILLLFPISTFFQHTNFFIFGAAFSQSSVVRSVRESLYQVLLLENLIRAH